MAGENCNVNKDEAEILKPASTSSASPPRFLKSSPQEFPAPERAEKPAVIVQEPAAEASVDADSCSPENESQPPPPPQVRFSNRCSSCRKKVGLTGFRCRCGDLFCGQHRYSDAHDCSFDYKAAGREQISKANPLIRAAKIIKI